MSAANASVLCLTTAHIRLWFSLETQSYLTQYVHVILLIEYVKITT